MPDSEPISEPKANSLGSGCLIPFGFIFFAAGSFFLYVMFIGPWLSSRAAQDWPSTPCTITESKIVSHRGDDSTTYSCKVEYTYFVTGDKYNGDQLSFVNFSSSHSSAAVSQRRFPKGSKQICYYDPHDPSTAVLDRENKNMMWWFIFLPIIFIIVGGGIMLAGIAGIFGWGQRDNSISGSVSANDENRRRLSFGNSGNSESRIDPTTGLTEADALDDEWATPRKLESSSGRVVAMIFLFLFACFWNGILSTFFIAGPLNDGLGFFSIFFALFMIPFVLVGLGMILGVGYLFLSLFNPKVEIALSTGAVALGNEVDIAWEVTGKVERIKELKITVHGTQSATFTRGTDTVTEQTIFEKIEVATVTDPVSIGFGSETVKIPEDSVPTFQSNHNAIAWTVEVKGSIPMAPDISESFTFRVTPDKTFRPVEKGKGGKA